MFAFSCVNVSFILHDQLAPLHPSLSSPQSVDLPVPHTLHWRTRFQLAFVFSKQQIDASENC